MQNYKAHWFVEITNQQISFLYEKRSECLLRTVTNSKTQNIEKRSECPPRTVANSRTQNIEEPYCCRYSIFKINKNSPAVQIIWDCKHIPLTRLLKLLHEDQTKQIQVLNTNFIRFNLSLSGSLSGSVNNRGWRTNKETGR